MLAQNNHQPTQIHFQPTLYLLLGTTPGQIGWRVKEQLFKAHGHVPVLRFLWADIDTSIDPQARPWFSPAERIELSGLDPAAVIKNVDNYPSIKEWWPESTLVQAGMLAGGGSPKQMRLVGRLAFFRMYNDRTRGPSLIDRLKSAVEALFEIDNIRATEALSNGRVQYTVDQGCRIVIIFNPSGGTGSSMAFDFAYLCRHLLRGKNPTIISIGVMPPVIDRAILNETHAQQEKIRANTYAWFKEDNYLSEHPAWHVQYPEGAPVDVDAPPFDYRFIIDIGNQAGYRMDSPEDVYDMIAQSIFLDTGSSVGGAMRGFTANVAALGERFEDAPRSYSSLAAASLIYPKARLLDYCAARLGRALLLQGLLGEPDQHQVEISISTLLSQLRLRDADLLADLIENMRIQMVYEASILKADSVASAVTQIDAQEAQARLARQSEVERLDEIAQQRLQELTAAMDLEITHLVSLKGIPFALRVLERLAESAPAGKVGEGVLCLDGLKTRLSQQGVSESDLPLVNQELEKARDALHRLDDGLEDRLERMVNLRGWNKKFNLFKRDCLTAIGKIDEISLQLAAQRDASSLYDQLSAKVMQLHSQLSSAMTSVKLAAAELLTTSDKLASKREALAEGYVFRQEIEIDFADYYHENSRQVEPPTVFQGMIPASVLGTTATFTQWVEQEIQSASLEFARKFFVPQIEATSLLDVLQNIAEKRGLDPLDLVQKELDRLIRYCHPFWEFDQNRGLHDLEGKSIIGVENEHSPLIPEVYRDSAMFEIKQTGFRDRIDVVRIWHGLPAFLLLGMNEYKSIYERKRRSVDPLHVLPGMEFAADLMPEQGGKNREMFAIGVVFGYIVQSGTWYYYDPERGFQEHGILPGREFRLAQGREKAEECFTHHEDWARKIDQEVDAEIRQTMGNEAAIRKLDEAIAGHRSAIAHMNPDDSLRRQFEKEIRAFQNMQRRLGKV
jgi:hypothetical protein